MFSKLDVYFLFSDQMLVFIFSKNQKAEKFAPNHQKVRKQKTEFPPIPDRTASEAVHEFSYPKAIALPRAQ